MATGAFFTGVGNLAGPDSPAPWTFDCTSSHCKLLVTDLFVISDQFQIYDFGSLIGTTSTVPDWNALGLPDPFAPPYTTDPDTAFASGFYSEGVFILAAGLHSITIRDIHIPPVSVGGPPFADGTVAFRVTVPEPGTLALLGIALAGFGFSRRKSSYATIGYARRDGVRAQLTVLLSNPASPGLCGVFLAAHRGAIVA